MAWRRIKHPSEVVEVGQDLKVMLKFDRERNRVSLGLKQLGTDPWDNVRKTIQWVQSLKLVSLT